MTRRRLESPPPDAVETLMARLDELGGYSDVEGELTRTYLGPAMRDVHRSLGSWMEAAGLQVRVDDAGNIVGRRAASGPQAKTLLVGSHLDTVRNAGKYDGVLGVLIGLSLVEALEGESLPFHLDVIGFSEEEGVRFGAPFIGSKAVTGTVGPDLLTLADKQGSTVSAAIRGFGLDPDALPQAVYDPARLVGYLEVHIEQGPRLAAQDVPVGVVSAIAGASRAKVSFSGQVGHAGTSPMHLRQDALTGAAEFILQVERLAAETEELVATVGQLELGPGAANVIPGIVRVSLDVRHIEDALRLETVARLKAVAGELAAIRNLKLEWRDLMNQRAVALDTRMTRLLEESAPEHAPTLASGAGHDAMIMATHTPSAMLFVRSPNGLSHHPDETIQPRDAAVALTALTRFVKKLAEQGA